MHLLQYFWNFPYIRWHIVFVFIPSLVLWFFNWKYFLQYKKTFIFVTLFIVILGLPADIFASVFLQLWYYIPSQHFGNFILGLPLGEYVFLLFFPQEFVALILLLRKKK